MRIPSFARALAAALLLPPLLAACNDKITAPPPLPDGVAGVYRLVSVDGQPLPADVGYALGVARRTEITAGAIQITTDARFIDATLYRLWYVDESGYEEFSVNDQGSVYASADGLSMEFHPAGTPSYVLSRDGTVLLQQWHDFELRYEKEDPVTASASRSARSPSRG